MPSERSRSESSAGEPCRRAASGPAPGASPNTQLIRDQDLTLAVVARRSGLVWPADAGLALVVHAPGSDGSRVGHVAWICECRDLARIATNSFSSGMGRRDLDADPRHVCRLGTGLCPRCADNPLAAAVSWHLSTQARLRRRGGCAPRGSASCGAVRHADLLVRLRQERRTREPSRSMVPRFDGAGTNARSCIRGP